MTGIGLSQVKPQLFQERPIEIESCHFILNYGSIPNKFIIIKTQLAIKLEFQLIWARISRFTVKYPNPVPRPDSEYEKPVSESELHAHSENIW